ncbi:MAG: hypothetical protein AAFQ92_19160 [Bacteroidota bacterium]
MNEVIKWIKEDGEYYEGVALLAKHAAKHTELALLYKRENPINRKKLRRALLSLPIAHDQSAKPSNRHKTVSEQIATPEVDIVVLPERKRLPSAYVGTGKYPPEIERIIQARATMVRKRDALSNQLRSCRSDEERAAKRKEILTLQDRIQEYNAKVSDWEKSGIVPQVVQKKVLTDDERRVLTKQLKNLRANRAKKRRKIKEWEVKEAVSDTVRNAELAKYREQEEELNKNIKELEQELNG